MKTPKITVTEKRRGYTFRSTLTPDLSTIDLFLALFDAVRKVLDVWMSHASQGRKLRLTVSIVDVSPMDKGSNSRRVQGNSPAFSSHPTRTEAA